MTSFQVRRRVRKDGSVRYLVVRKEKRAGVWRTEVVESGIESEREALRIKKQAKQIWRDNKHAFVDNTALVDAILDGYLASIADTESHEGMERYARLHVRPTLGKLQIGKLERDHVQALLDQKQADGYEPQSLQHMRSVLRAAIFWAKKKKLFAGDNPATGVEIKTRRKKIVETLEPDEVMLVLPEIAKHERAMVAWSFYGGFRPGELAAMRDEHVHLEKRYVDVVGSHERDETKTGNERIVPIAEPLVPYVKDALEHAKEGVLFHAGRGGRRLADNKGTEMLRAAMRRAAGKGATSLVTGWTLKCRRKGCGYQEEAPPDAILELRHTDKRCPRCAFILWPSAHVRDVKYYNLRHSTATLLAEAGVQPALIAAILGHDVRVLIDRYFAFSAKKLVAAVNKLGALSTLSTKKSGDHRGQPVVTPQKGTL